MTKIKAAHQPVVQLSPDTQFQLDEIASVQQHRRLIGRSLKDVLRESPAAPRAAQRGIDPGDPPRADDWRRKSRGGAK